MILPASEVASLKSALGCWELVGYISTGVVFLGCVGEFIAEFTSFSREEDRKHKLSRLSLIVLIAGIAGELLGGVRVSQISGELIANVEQEAGRAIKAAEDERMARLQIEKSMQWRELSEAAKKALCKILPPQSATDETVVLTVWNDPEPASYAEEFADTIGSCRPFPVPIGTNPHQGPKLALPPWTFPLKFGVNLEFPAKDARIAASLLAALQADGVDAHIPPAKDRQFPATVNRLIVVGPRAYPNSGDSTNSK